MLVRYLTTSLQIGYFFIHRLYLHPLAKYPGPFLAKFTTFYAGYHAWMGDIHIDMWRCHEKYGMLQCPKIPQLVKLISII